MSNSEWYEEVDPSEIYKLEDSKDVEGLIAVLKHSQNKNVIKLAIQALGRLKDDRAVEPLIDKALKSELVTIRAAAVRALGEIGNPKAVEPLIIVLLKGPTWDVRQKAAHALGKIRDARAVGFLITVSEDGDEETSIKEAAAEALGKIANDGAITALIHMLDTSMEEKASLVLKEVGEPAVEHLISALNSKSQTIRERVVTILGELGDKMAVKPLLSLLVDENEDEYFRGDYVATALGKIGDARAVEPLIKLASKHSEDILTCMSVRALGDICDHQAVEPLIAILEDRKTSECSHLRLETCWALRKLKDPRAIESLIKILENPRKTTYGLEDAAASALVELDDDRIELPLLKYFKVELDAYDEHWAKAVGKLIARLIKKAKMP